jgi:hypothetical protein
MKDKSNHTKNKNEILKLSGCIRGNWALANKSQSVPPDWQNAL